uniref:Lamin-1 n=1 Tax=Parascaris univalens TaxID=6257 RepID=A0A915BPD4_PARUN
MSAKQRQRSSARSVTTSSSSRTEYPVSVNTDESSESFSISMMSPNRQTRLLEKETLSNLNDRLAVYIDRVRQLEMENARLNVRINESEVVEKKEREDLVARYETKIKELRDFMDEALKDKTRLNMDAKTALAERDNLRAKIGKLEKDLKQSEKSRLSVESLIQDLQARVNSADNMRKHLEDENKGLAAENAELKRQLEVLRKQVEDEAIVNTALHNQNQSLKEDYEFLKKTHEGQLEEIHRKRQVEMTTTAREIERTYESRLQEQLQAMRAEFDARLNKNRRDIDETYKNKMNEANEARQQANQAREESARLRLRIHELEKTAGANESRVDALNKKISDLENQLRFVRDDADVRLQQRDSRIAELQQEIDRILSEYQDLFELKVQLDTELRAYQSLLEGEESRLNISQQSSVSSSGLGGHGGGDAGSSRIAAYSSSQLGGSPRRSVKRKRFIASDNSSFFRNTAKTYKTTANSDCDVEIDAHDTNGKFVRLINKGDEAVSIGQWSIKSVASERETVYKFHSRQLIKPGDTITVWSADSGEKSAPPSQLVMKNQQWPAGDHVKTVLVDPEGAEMAMRESVAELQVGSFGQDDEQDPDQRCSLM